ncbi:MAG: winged helix-turn-helix domain-containing protein [Thermoplasmata archaeon]
MEKTDDYSNYNVLNYLGLTPGKWEIKYNEKIRGLSGKDHVFDSVYKSENGELVTVSFILDCDDMIKRIAEFHLDSEDVMARRKFLITCGRIDDRTILNLKSVGISTLILPDMFCHGKNNLIINKNEDLDTSLNENLKTRSDKGENGHSAGGKRSRANIILDIMNTISLNKNGIPLTRLFYSCNLNHQTGRRIVENLEFSGIIRVKKTGSGRNIAELTDKGKDLVNDYKFISEILRK